MRVECKHYESRTYASGETVRKCDLDLAPEAPWRCPDNCPAFEARLADVNWSYGSLVEAPTPPEPEGEGVEELLDEAEDIINAAVPAALSEVRVEPVRGTGRGAGGGGGGSWWRRWLPRRNS